MADPQKLITPAGYKKLKDEIEWLWKVERPRVTTEVADAAAQGDRSENAEYIYGKKRLREIDRRLRFLGKRLDAVTVVRPSRTASREHVGFGAWVSLEDEDGAARRYQIVGTDEFDVDNGKISVASPIARALLAKRVDDEVEVQRPSGEVWFTVTAIDWPEDDDA